MRSLEEREQAKRVMVGLVAQARILEGLTRLYKAFYVAHLFYAKDAPGFLTGWPIVRMPKGPGIESGAILIDELVNAGLLRKEATMSGPYPTAKLSLGDAATSDYIDALGADAKKAIENAWRFVEGHSCTALSDWSHEQSRSWQSTPDGRELNIYVDLIEDSEFEKREASLKELDREIVAVWGNG